MPKQNKSSNVRRFPSGRPASMHPDEMVPAFDVVHQLSKHPDRHHGDSSLSILGFPGFLRTNLDRIRAHVDPYPSVSKTVCCCISGGLTGISRNEQIQGLIDLKLRFDRMPAEADTDDLEDVAMWFRSFPLGIPNPTFSAARRLNVAITEPVKGRLQEMADRLGLSQSSLAGLAVMVVLADQTQTAKRDRQTLEKILSLFVARIRRRQRVGEVLLESFE